MEENWGRKYLGEFIGTYVLVLLGVGAVFVAVYTGAYGNLHAVMWMWGLAVACAVYVGAAISGAHYNPSVTITMAVLGKFPWKQVIPFVVSQVAGAFAAAATLWSMYGGFAAPFEAANKITRGQPGSQLSAMVLHCFSPNPGIVGTSPEAYSKVPLYAGFLSEFVGTGLLLIFILALLEQRNGLAPNVAYFPITLALGVFVIVGITAPLSMTSLNGARDLGPRLLAYLLGWGRMAFPGPRGEWWLFSVVPALGGVCGGLLFQKVILPCYPAPQPAAVSKKASAGAAGD